MINRKNIISIDFDDDDMNYSSFADVLEKDTERKKNKIALDFDENGENFLKEIEWKKIRQQKASVTLIKYILKKSHNKYCEEELNSYSFEDIKEIYNEVKSQNKSIFAKFFQFLFNL